MTALPHNWPAAFQPLLAGLERNPARPGCYFTDVEVTTEQLRELNLFEGASRHHPVCFMAPALSEPLKGEMNPLLGLGAPAKDAGADALVRISFHDATSA
jgi:hypothetical protein